MGGQVLGGGVIVLVCVLLWLVYLLPSWHSRHQFNAAERNAVRLNQALRVLAETSETPEEVQLELNARTAFAQQRLARQAQSVREQVALEEARQELEIARSLPAARRARARRRARLVTLTLALGAVGLAVWGGWDVVSGGSQLLMWSAVGLLALCGLVLSQMARVAARHGARGIPAAERTRHAPTSLQDVALGADERTWEPRQLPRPLASSAGSRAAAVLDGAAAREALRQAAVEEAMREREERRQPPSIDAARHREAVLTADDDAAIEAHVRALLERRATG